MNETPVRPEPNTADLEQLNLLGIFHYIVGGLMFFFASFFTLYVVMGLMMALDPGFFEGPKGKGEPPPAIFGFFFAGIGGFIVLSGWITAGLTVYSGRCLQKHRRRTYSLVMAGIACFFMPFGTILGVFTIVVLMRESVVRLYKGQIEQENLQSATWQS